MSTSSTTSIINGATTRFMSLLLPCWRRWGHIAPLQIQERQHRRRLLTIEHIHLFHGGENLPHRLQVEAPTRYLRRLLVFGQQRLKTRGIPLSRIGTVDGIALSLGNSAFGFATLAGHFLIEGLHRLVGLPRLLLLRLVHLIEGAFDLV